jgi:hypothetical protein
MTKERQALADDDDRRGFDVVPALVLIGLVLLGVLGWWIYPKLQSYMAEQDCIATGRTNCQ